MAPSRRVSEDAIRLELLIAARRLDAATQTVARLRQLDPRLELYCEPIVAKLRAEFDRIRLLGNMLDAILDFTEPLTQPAGLVYPERIGHLYTSPLRMERPGR